jgi:serine/threonine protein kinase
VRSREGTFQTTAVRPGALTELLAQLVQPDGERPSAGWEVPLTSGESVGRFEILREVGRGGFGVVYEARDSELGRSVAFKAVRTSGLTELKADRLLAEAEAAARLAHPNIVHLYDLGRCDRGAFLILELLKGKTLAERLEEGPLPAREALRVAVEAARGLAHAHAQGVVHRDLKPGNVFLCEDGQVKLLDFGLAHVFGKGA